MLTLLPIIQISLLCKGLLLLAFYLAHSDNEFVELSLGHDIRSPGAHFLTLSPSNNEVCYSIGAGLLNILANMAFLFAFYCVGLTGVNIMQLVNIYALVMMVCTTLIDRGLVLLNRNLESKYPWLIIILKKSKDKIFLPKDIGIHVTVPSLILDLHASIFNLADTEIPMPSLKREHLHINVNRSSPISKINDCFYQYIISPLTAKF
jgi:hypothetical protein